jgi:two-component system CheB/CheR fusion protein
MSVLMPSNMEILLTVQDTSPPLLADPQPGQPWLPEAASTSRVDENDRVSRLLDLIDHIPGVVWETETAPDLSVVKFSYLSDSAERLLGYSREELLRPALWREMVHTDDREKFQQQYQNIFTEGDRGTIQHRVITKDGRALPIEATITLVRNAQGVPIAMRGITLDISERYQIAQHLEEAKEAAEVASRTKDQFIATLSHELRTPLTPVLATVQLLAEDKEFPERFRPFLDLIHRNIELEARLIDDLLDMTRVAKGKLQLMESDIDLHALIPEVIEICQQELESNKLRVMTRFQAANSWLRGDRDRLSQVFWNLLHNATKFTPEHGIVTLRTRNDDGGHILVEIEDTGKGIEATELRRIFEPFEQERAIEMHRHTPTQSGLGLGLAISKSIVELHGGAIEAKSPGPGKGTTFTMQLNASEAKSLEQKKEAYKSQNGATPEVSSNAHRGTSGRGRRILLVDDHLDTNAALKVLLERRGYQVTTATSVARGVELAHNNEFDLLVSDIGLPDGDGMQLLQEIQKKQLLKAIAVSGYSTETDRQRSLDAGFLRHLKKPIAFPDLERAIAELLE